MAAPTKNQKTESGNPQALKIVGINAAAAQ